MRAYGMILVGGGESGRDQTACFTKSQVATALGQITRTKLKFYWSIIGRIWTI